MAIDTGRVMATVGIPQLRLGGILVVWTAATAPMALLAWVVAPLLARSLSGPDAVPMVKALSICLTAGLVWQFVLVMALVWRERRSLRWPVLREALWLTAPRNPRTGRTDHRLWLLVAPFIVLFFAQSLIPTLPSVSDRDLGVFLGSANGMAFFDGAWGWFALTLVMMLFNTVLGEELLFRGYLLPRMNGALGRVDWVANGLLFAAYHIHVPWVIPVALLDMITLAWPTKTFRSAWFGILVHSSQSVFFGGIVLALVL